MGSTYAHLKPNGDKAQARRALDLVRNALKAVSDECPDVTLVAWERHPDPLTETESTP